MINILIGASAMVLLFISHYTAYYIGRKHRKADTAAKLSREEEEAFQRHMKGMENVLNYDYAVAIGKKVGK